MKPKKFCNEYVLDSSLAHEADYMDFVTKELSNGLFDAAWDECQKGECIVSLKEPRAEYFPSIKQTFIKGYCNVTKLVRCKDCAYSYDTIDGLVCCYGPCVDCIVPENFFCATGDIREERKPNEHI